MRNKLFIAGLLLVSINIYGQEKNLSLDDFVRLALERNPKIKSMTHIVDAQRHRIAPEGALPDPVLSFSVKNMGLDRWMVGQDVMSGVGVSVSQMVPFPGKLKLKSEVAAQKAYRTEEGLRAAKLAVVREVKELYARLFYYQKARELLIKKKDILENALKTAEAKYAVGQGVQPDIFKAQVEISGIEEMVLTMDGMAQSAKASLNSALDFPPENPLAMSEEIPLTSLPMDLKQIQAAASKNSPLLRNAALMIEESHLEVAMAKKEFYPNFMIQAGKDFRGVLPDMYEVMIGVEIPLFYRQKQANLLEESVARLSSSQQDLNSMKDDLNAMLSENFLMAKTSENLIKLYKEKIIPQTTLALESSMANYRVNKVDFLMLLSDINALFSTQMEYFKNLTNLWAAAAKIEELTSLELIKPANESGQGENHEKKME